MSKPLQVGLTGGIGSGKTTVAKIFEHLGISVYDADSRAKFLMTTDGNLVQAIKKEFGKLAYRPDETLDRSFLAAAVFGSSEKRQVLNSLIHPALDRDYAVWVEVHGNDTYLLKDAALLIETGSYKALDKIILVIAPEDLRVSRILRRDPERTESDVRKIMGAQMDDTEKMKYADFIVKNDEQKLLVPQVLDLHGRLLALGAENR